MLLADSLRSSGLYQESIKIYDGLIKKINKHKKVIGAYFIQEVSLMRE